MIETRTNPFAQRLAWTNYRSRMADTLSFLEENLQGADEDAARDQIARQIERHTTYLQKADERLADLEHNPI
jgi:cyclopropane fatty-acyl-phospholipid synthase-like methyltransferase